MRSKNWLPIVKGGLIVLFMIILTILFYPHPRNCFWGFDTKFHSVYKSIVTGMDLKFVLERMGPAIKSDDKLILPQEIGYAEVFERAANSNAVMFYQWRNGSNWFYCIGVDINNMVVFKAEGSS